MLGTGETLWFGRAPHAALDDLDLDPDAQLGATVLTLPHCAAHVSRLLGRGEVGEKMVRLRWTGSTEAQVSSLFDAPGGARRVTALERDVGAPRRGGQRRRRAGRARAQPGPLRGPPARRRGRGGRPGGPAPAQRPPHDSSVTAPAPLLEEQSREWFVALALAEPWLSGTDDYPRPPSNREIYERVLGWHGDAWNLERSQRVDD